MQQQKQNLRGKKMTEGTASTSSKNDLPSSSSSSFFFPQRRRRSASSPFVCSILGSYSDDDNEPQNSVLTKPVRVLQRLIRTLPSSIGVSASSSASSAFNEGEVEVCLEEYADTSWKVVLRDGMRCVVHQTFALPSNNNNSSNFGSINANDNDTNPINSSSSSSIINEALIDPIVCWAYFSSSSSSTNNDRGKLHKQQLNTKIPQQRYLCVLVSCNQLQILLYSTDNEINRAAMSPNYTDTVDDDHDDDDGCIAPGIVVPLPFDACAIYTNPLGGIFIQRAITADDEHGYSSFLNNNTQQPSSWNLRPPDPLVINTTYNNQMDIDDDKDNDNQHFFFGSNTRSNRKQEEFYNNATTTNTLQNTVGIPSLFTLRHHLDEIRPVAVVTDDTNTNNLFLFSNAYEKVIYVEQHILVTFHTYYKRHAVWILSKSLPQPPEVPMYEILKQQQQQQQQDEEETQIPQRPHSQQQLYPSVSVKPIWMENISTTNQQLQAKCVFFASDRWGRSNILCFLVKQHSKTTSKTNNNHHMLRLFSLTNNDDVITGMTHINDILCISAQPIQASNGESIDILVLQADDDDDSNYPTNRLYLYRSDFCIVECAFPSSTLQISLFGSTATTTGENSNIPRLLQENNISIVDLKHSSSCRVNVLFRITSPNNKNHISHCSVRTTVSLVSMLSSITDTSLKAIECLILSPSYPTSSSCSTQIISELCEFVLMLRSDCIRAMQFFGIGALLEEVVDPSWKAFSMIIRGLLLSSSTLTDSSSDDGKLSNIQNVDIDFQDEDVIDNVDDDDDDGDAWSFLINSEFGRNFERANSKLFQYRKRLFPEEETDDETQYSHQHRDDMILFDKVNSGINLQSLKLFEKALHLPLMFDALHLLYEDAKLVSASRGPRWVFQLGLILSSIVGNMIAFRQQHELRTNAVTRLAAQFLDHYRRDNGDEALPTHAASISDKKQKMKKSVCAEESSTLTPFTTFGKPPCIFSWLEYLIQRGRESYFFPILHNVCVATQRIHRFYSVLFQSSTFSKQQVDSKGSSSQSEKDEQLIFEMINVGIHDLSEFYSEIPPSIAIPIMAALRRCRDDPPLKNTKFSIAAFQLVGRNDLAVMEMIKQGFLKRPKPSTPASRFRSSCGSIAAKFTLDSDEILPDAPEESIELYSSMLFPFDERIKEVSRLLRSSIPYFLRVKRPVEVSDHDFEGHKQAKLLLLCRRGLAAPLGRGMLTFATVPPILAEPVHIPGLSLEGRMPPNNAILKLDTSVCPSDMMIWPEFHNGVAAGLRVDFSSFGDGSSAIREEGREQEIRTWIVYNKPTLSGLDNPSNHPSPNVTASTLATANHAHGGFLMALGLRGYLSALAITDIYEYLTQGIVTTTVGVLLGMAANKRGTCDAAVSKMLCLHIPSLLPPSFSAMEVASAAQAAAVSGIGLLYHGTSHRMMTEFLLNEIGRRPTSDSSTHDREGFTLSCGLALGMVNICKGGEDMSGLADLRIVERLMKYVVGGRDGDDFQRRREANDRATATSFGLSDQEKTSRIYEGDLINTNVTAPAATLALGLIFMRSRDKSIASRLSLPDTNFLLDYVRPDFLLLRVVSRSLILWHEVAPTIEWINNQIPSVLKKSYDMLRKTAFGLRTSQVDGDDEPVVEEDNIENDLNMTNRFSVDSHVDRQSVRQAHAFIIAGGCLSIGLRYAGTGNKTAASTVMKCVWDFYQLRKDNDPLSAALRPEKQILEICCACSALSLAIVMAGTGDMEIFRLLRELRWLCDEDIRYGTHMSYGAAIGLLFLGGGSCTLGNEPEDIASLVMAFFPYFPDATCDNQYHLQALRHVYALAVRQRSVETIDIDSNQPVFVPVELRYTDEESNKIVQHLTTPCCIAPNPGRTLELRLASNRYFPLSIELSQNGRLLSPSVVYVKKRSGNLSYVQDPRALKTLVVQAEGSSGSVVDLIRSFTEDPRLISFAELLCDSTEKPSLVDDFSTPPNEFCAEILVECLTQGKTEVLPILLSLRNRIIEQETIAVPNIWDLRLLRSVVLHNNGSSSGSIVNEGFMALLCDHVDRYFSLAGFSGDDAISYFNDPWIRNPLLGSFLTWFDIPSPFG